jgi:predicted nucleic acid-binding protein
MREVLRAVDAGTVVAYSSTITLTEVLTQPLRLGNTLLADEYRQRLFHGRNLTLRPINSPVAELAADLRARYRLHTPDALQIAAALDAGCEAFLCNDLGLRRVTELRVLVLDELEL